MHTEKSNKTDPFPLSDPFDLGIDDDQHDYDSHEVLKLNSTQIFWIQQWKMRLVFYAASKFSYIKAFIFLWHYIIMSSLLPCFGIFAFYLVYIILFFIIMLQYSGMWTNTNIFYIQIFFQKHFLIRVFNFRWSFYFVVVFFLINWIYLFIKWTLEEISYKIPPKKPKQTNKKT